MRPIGRAVWLYTVSQHPPAFDSGFCFYAAINGVGNMYKNLNNVFKYLSPEACASTFPSGSEIGRSMIEMLGVLAIIGVLSVGGIAGYGRRCECGIPTSKKSS